MSFQARTVTCRALESVLHRALHAPPCPSGSLQKNRNAKNQTHSLFAIISMIVTITPLQHDFLSRYSI